MKDRLRDLGIKMTEMAGYMRISRQSLYRYVESYEAGDYRSVQEKVLRTFRYIDKNKALTKEDLITYVICEFANSAESDIKESVRKYLLNKSAKDQKIELMYKIISSDWLDPLIPYLNNTLSILSKGSITESEAHQVVRLALLKSNISKGVPLSESEMEFADTLRSE